MRWQPKCSARACAEWAPATWCEQQKRNNMNNVPSGLCANQLLRRKRLSARLRRGARDGAHAPLPGAPGRRRGAATRCSDARQLALGRLFPGTWVFSLSPSQHLCNDFSSALPLERRRRPHEGTSLTRAIDETIWYVLPLTSHLAYLTRQHRFPYRHWTHLSTFSRS